MSDDNMSDEITIRPQSESASTPASAGSKDSTASSIGTQLTNLCALGLGICFFLPWAHIFLGNPSGFDLQKLGDEKKLLWLIPIFSVLTLIASVNRRTHQVIAQLTGILPYCASLYWYSKLGSDLFHVIAYGGYLSLIFGAVMFFLPRNTK